MNYSEIIQKLQRMPRDQAHKVLYKLCTGRELNLDSPSDLDEKIQWLMVNRYDKNVSAFADKYLVREYVKKKGYEHILPKLYGVYQEPGEIDLEELPEKFVLKANHGSGSMFLSVCTDKKNYDKEGEFDKLKRSLSLDYSLTGLEHHYTYIQPRIICEEYLEEEGALYPPDYKFFCFNGQAKYIKIVTGRDIALKHDYYDADWNHYFYMTEKYQCEHRMERPKMLEEMTEIASALSTPFPVVRVDLYCVNDRIYFGEMTLTPETGMNKKDKRETIEYFGTLVDLDYWKPEELDFMREEGLEQKAVPLSKQLKQLVVQNSSILSEIDRIIMEFHHQNFDSALRSAAALMNSLEESIRSLLPEAEFFQSVGCPIEIAQITNIFQGLMEAQEQRDYVLLADLLELQLRPFYIQMQETAAGIAGGGVAYDPQTYRTNYFAFKESRRDADQSIAQILNKTRMPKVILEGNDYSVEYTSSGFPTLCRHWSDRSLYFHSNGNPYQAGLELALSWYDESESRYLIFGLGFAYHALALAEHDNSIQIDIYEYDENILQLACAFADLKKLMSFPNVTLYFDPTLDEFSRNVMSLSKKSFAQKESAPKLVIHYPTLEAMPNTNKKRQLQNYFTEYTSLLNQSRFLNGNFRYNSVNVTRSVDDLKEQFHGKDIYLVAAGPSLDYNFMELSKIKENGIILAVGTVFRKLMAAGIRPDYVVITDANERVISQIEGLKACDIPLILLSTAYRGFAKEYAGVCYLACQSDYPAAEEMAAKKGWQLYATGGSVATFALELAIRFQGRRVICLGLDLSYPGNLVHAQDTSERELPDTAELRQVTDINGKPVYTGRAMDIYRQWIERRIQEPDAKEIPFIDATEGGAKIAGMELKRLCDVIKPHCSEEKGKATDLTRLESLADHYISKKDSLYELQEPERKALMKDCCLVMGSDAENRLKSKFMSILYHIAFLEDLSLEECWQIYWNINRVLFLNHNLYLIDGDLDELYRYIFRFVKSNLDYTEKTFRPIRSRNQEKVVMITSQFLSIGHAPTTRVLDYSYTLKKHKNMEVIIINDAGMNYYKQEHLDGVVDFNFIEEYSEKEFIHYKGEKFEFFQVGSQMPNIAVLQCLLDSIYEMNPLFLYNIGGSCLTSDLCTDFVTTVSLPCAFQIPVSCSSYLLLGRHLNETDDLKLSRLEQHQRVIETNFNYIFRESKQVYTREEFGLPKDSFVLSVVGNRLDDELNAEFLQLMNRVLETEFIDFRLALVGGMKQQDRILAKLGVDKKKVCFTGSIPDASEFIRLTNLNVNPDRSGGGRAAFEAFHYGIPAASLRKGDAYYAGGYEFGCDNYDDFYETICRYAKDQEFYSQRSKMALEREALLSNMAKTQELMMERVFGFEQEKEEAGV